MGLTSLTLADSTLAAITLGNFVVLHDVTAPGLHEQITYGIRIKNGIERRQN